MLFCKKALSFLNEEVLFYSICSFSDFLSEGKNHSGILLDRKYRQQQKPALTA